MLFQTFSVQRIYPVLKYIWLILEHLDLGEDNFSLTGELVALPNARCGQME